MNPSPATPFVTTRNNAANNFKTIALNGKEPTVITSEARVAETSAILSEDIKIPEETDKTSPEEEKELVEDVNQLLGVMGRQSLNGAQIFSTGSDNDVVLPGRPNLEPFETNTGLGGLGDGIGRPQGRNRT